MPDVGRIAARCAVLLLALAPAPAWAHKVNVFAVVEGDDIRGEAYYRGRSPVQDGKVTVQGPAGRQLGQTTTDARGKFTFRPKVRCDHTLVLDAGDGHTEQYVVPAAELPANLPPASSASPDAPPPAAATATAPSAGPPAKQSPCCSLSAFPTDLAALQAQIAQLRRELDEFKNQTQWRDILGGIGYILGLTGLASYFLGARRKPT